MDKKLVISIINVLQKSDEKRVVYKALLKIRTDLVKDKTGILLFSECGGIAPLVKLIGKPYVKILELALSILANCCTVKECCKEAIKCGVVSPLLTLLKRVPNEAIQCRGCRLIGNLARESNEKISNLAKDVGTTLAGVFDDITGVDALTMAVRAVRLLWNETAFHGNFIYADGIGKICTILVDRLKIKDVKEAAPSQSIVEQDPDQRRRVAFLENHVKNLESINSRVFDLEMAKKLRPQEECYKLPESRDQLGLLSEILRCLQEITAVQTMRSAYVMRFPGCDCIVFLAAENSPFRAHALKVLSNMSKSAEAQQILSTSNAVTCACDLLTSLSLVKPLTSDEERYCISIICLLTGDSCYRAKIRRSGVLKRLLEIARNTECDQQWSMILLALHSFRYDRLSIGQMIKMGLIGILIKRLNSISEMVSKVHAEIKNGEVDAESGCCKRPQSKKRKTDFSGPSITQMSSFIDFPNTSFNAFPASPSGSSSSYLMFSPRSERHLDFLEYDDDDDADGNYSPVCSDKEEDEPISSGVQIVEDKAEETSASVSTKDSKTEDISACEMLDDDLKDIFADVVSGEEEHEPESKSESFFATLERQKSIELIVGILSEVSVQAKDAAELVNPETLKILVKMCAWDEFLQNRAEDRWNANGVPYILSNIVGETKNFLQILKQDFVYEMYEVLQPPHETAKCQICVSMSRIRRGLLDTLNIVADTSYGRGEITQLLRKEEPETQTRVAIIITYIIRSPKTLHYLLVECSALYLVMNTIFEKTSTLCSAAASGITALAIALSIGNTGDESTIKQYGPYVEAGTLYRITERADRVTLIAGDGGDRVQFSESILTEASEVFERMFNSNFRESNEKMVHFQKTSIAGLKYFLRALMCSLDEIQLEAPPSEQINIVLEAYELCSSYMLDSSLRDSILDVIKFLLSADTVVQIFEFALTFMKPNIVTMSIEYCLSANIPGETKVGIFRKADDSKYCTEWNNLMLSTIVLKCEDGMM